MPTQLQTLSATIGTLLAGVGRLVAYLIASALAIGLGIALFSTLARANDPHVSLDYMAIDGQQVGCRMTLAGGTGAPNGTYRHGQRVTGACPVANTYNTSQQVTVSMSIETNGGSEREITRRKDWIPAGGTFDFPVGVGTLPTQAKLGGGVPIIFRLMADSGVAVHTKVNRDHKVTIREATDPESGGSVTVITQQGGSIIIQSGGTTEPEGDDSSSGSTSTDNGNNDSVSLVIANGVGCQISPADRSGGEPYTPGERIQGVCHVRNTSSSDHWVRVSMSVPLAGGRTRTLTPEDPDEWEIPANSTGWRVHLGPFTLPNDVRTSYDTQQVITFTLSSESATVERGDLSTAVSIIPQSDHQGEGDSTTIIRVQDIALDCNLSSTSSRNLTAGDQVRFHCYVSGLYAKQQVQVALTYHDNVTGIDTHDPRRGWFTAGRSSVELTYDAVVPANLNASGNGFVYVGLWDSWGTTLAWSDITVTFGAVGSTASPELHPPTTSGPSQSRMNRCKARIKACMDNAGWLGDALCRAGDWFACDFGGTLYGTGEALYKNVKRLARECGATEGTTLNKVWRLQKGFWAGFAIQSDDPCVAYGEEWSAFTAVGDLADVSDCIAQGCNWEDVGLLIASAGPLPPWKKIKQLDDLAKRMAEIERRSPLDELVDKNRDAADDFRRLKNKMDSDCPVDPGGKGCLGAVHEYDANAYLSSLSNPKEVITRIPPNKLPDSSTLKRTDPKTNTRVISDGESKYGPNGKYKNVTEVRPTGNHGSGYFGLRMRAAKADGIHCFTIFIYEGAGGALPQSRWETHVHRKASEAGIGLRIFDMSKGRITLRGTSTCPGQH